MQSIPLSPIWPGFPGPVTDRRPCNAFSFWSGLYLLPFLIRTWVSFPTISFSAVRSPAFVPGPLSCTRASTPFAPPPCLRPVKLIRGPVVGILLLTVLGLGPALCPHRNPNLSCPTCPSAPPLSRGARQYRRNYHNHDTAHPSPLPPTPPHSPVLLASPSSHTLNSQQLHQPYLNGPSTKQVPQRAQVGLRTTAASSTNTSGSST